MCVVVVCVYRVYVCVDCGVQWLTERLYALVSWLKQSISTPPSSMPWPRARRDSSLPLDIYKIYTLMCGRAAVKTENSHDGLYVHSLLL